MTLNTVQFMSEDEFAKKSLQWFRKNINLFNNNDDTFAQFDIDSNKLILKNKYHKQSLSPVQCDENAEKCKQVIRTDNKVYCQIFGVDLSKYKSTASVGLAGRFTCMLCNLFYTFRSKSCCLSDRGRVFYKYIRSLVLSAYDSSDAGYFFKSSSNQRALLCLLDSHGLSVIPTYSSRPYDDRVDPMKLYNVSVDELTESLCIGFASYFSKCLLRGLKLYCRCDSCSDYVDTDGFHKSSYLVDGIYYQDHLNEYGYPLVDGKPEHKSSLSFIISNGKIYGDVAADDFKPFDDFWWHKFVNSINDLLDQYYEMLKQNVFNTDKIPDDDNKHFVDRNFYDYFINTLHAGRLTESSDSNIVFSLVHLLYVLTRSDKFLDSWLSGEAYDSHHYYLLFLWYINHFVLNPKFKYNFLHKYYSLPDILKRVFGVYLQVEMLVLDDTVIHDKLIPSIVSLFNDSNKVRMQVYDENLADKSLLSWAANRRWVNNNYDTPLLKVILCTTGSTTATYDAINQVDNMGTMSGMRRHLCKDYDSVYLYDMDKPLSQQSMSELYMYGPSVSLLASFVLLINKHASSGVALDADVLFRNLDSLCQQRHNDSHDPFMYSKERQVATEVLAYHNVSILTGVAGAGKTTYLQQYVHAFIDTWRALKSDQPLYILGATLSAKACAQLANSITHGISDEDASSIICRNLASWLHVCGRVDVYDAKDKHDEDEQRPAYYDAIKHCSLLLVDEFSMPDEESLITLLKHVLPDCRIVFIGDPEQLPTFTGTPFIPDIEHLVESDNKSSNIFSSVGQVKLLTSIRNQGDIYKVCDILRSDTSSGDGLSEANYAHTLRTLLYDDGDGSIDYCTADDLGFKNNRTQQLAEDVGNQFVNDTMLVNYDMATLNSMGCVVATNKLRDRINFVVERNLQREFLSKGHIYRNNRLNAWFYLGIMVPSSTLIGKDNTLCILPNDRVTLTTSFRNEGQFYSDLSKFHYEASFGSSMPKTLREQFANELPHNMTFIVRDLYITDNVDVNDFLMAHNGSNDFTSIYIKSNHPGKYDINADKYSGKRSSSNLQGLQYGNVRAYSASNCDAFTMTLQFVDYPDSYITVSGKSLALLASNLDLAYAFTVHKAQGATYSKLYSILPYVDINNPNDFVTRNLIYTTFSRASDKLFIRSYNNDWMNWCYRDQSYAYHDAQLLAELFEMTDKDVTQRLQSSSNQ